MVSTRSGVYALRTEQKSANSQRFEQKRPSTGLHLNSRSIDHFGLIQERLPGEPGDPQHIYSLIIQSILWNQTPGRAALPVLCTLLEQYPDPQHLALASEADLQQLLQPLGLWRQRAKRLIDMAKIWVDAPPCPSRTYKKAGYGPGPQKKNSKRKRGEPEQQHVTTDEWEVARLPGVGAYALDSYRIFCRDG